MGFRFSAFIDELLPLIVIRSNKNNSSDSNDDLGKLTTGPRSDPYEGGSSDEESKESLAM